MSSERTTTHDLDRISLLYLAWQEAGGYALPQSGVDTRRITGGNDRLPRALAAELGDRVHLSSPVTRIEHGRDGVDVLAGGRRVDATWLVLPRPRPRYER